MYFVVPKVGCSSIKTALLPVFGIRPYTGGHDLAYEVHALFGDSPYQIDKSRLLAEFDRYRHWFRFAFVRNPWDRLLSCYSQKLAPGGQGLGREEYAGERLWVGMSFPEFVEAVCRIPDQRADPHFRSQHVAVCSNGRRKRVLANYVGRYERLAPDFAVVAEKIGVEPDLPHLLPSAKKAGSSYRDHYDRKLAQLVGERYRLDAEIFGYSF